jgi:hypothetical protein
MAVRQGYREARRRLQPPDEQAPSADRETYRLALEYLAPGAEGAAFAALLAVDGCFDVGSALSPVRVTEIALRARAVPYPTDELLLLPARSVADLPSAAIEDPRALLPSLAMGRLLARKFVQREPVPRQRTRLVGEVRIYVLDGSTSMLEGGGARARVRDAVLLAELSTLLQRFEAAPAARRGRGAAPEVRVVLFYRYFTKRLGPVKRVDSGPTALAAIGDVLGEPRGGGTDIEQALVESFALIREEGERDPDLARAQIVLITDGQALVREEAVHAAREQAFAGRAGADGRGAVPIQVSVIALGEENPALRAIVARQRARGERAFYHHLSDDALREICDGGIHRGAAIHLPKSRGEELAALRVELEALLDDLTADAARRAGRGAAEAPSGAAARPSAFHLVEGALARREAEDRDHRALAARFDRWFPPPVEGEGGPLPAPGTREREDLDAARILLATVAEVVREEVGSTAPARRADAIDLLERLLPDARLPPGRYEAVLREHPAHLALALAAVRTAVAPPSPRR